MIESSWQDWLLWLMRSLHILAATAWVGGSMMYQWIVIPALRASGPAPTMTSQIALAFKRLVNYCSGILLLSGIYLLVDRLSQTTLGLLYIVVLILKILAAIIVFGLAFYMAQSATRRIAKRVTRFSRLAPSLMLTLGICLFILGALLNYLFEASLLHR